MDRVITSKTYTETAGDVNIYITETLVNRTQDGKTFKVNIKDKRYVGPRGPVERLLLKKYDKAPCKTVVADDVFLEFTEHKRIEEEEVNNTIYVNAARTDGWSDAEVSEIIRSKNPSHTWKRIFSAKLDSMTTRPVVVPKKEDTVGMKIGLKARLGQQKMARETQVETQTKGTGVSLADKLRSKKEQSHESEQQCTLFLDNVPEEYTSQDIKRELQDFNVTRVNVVAEKNGSKQSIGRAFVVLRNIEETQSCMEYINTQCRWGHFVVNAVLAKPKVTE